VDSDDGTVHGRSGRWAHTTEVDRAPDGRHILVGSIQQALFVCHDVRPLSARRRGLGDRSALSSAVSLRFPCSPIACPSTACPVGPRDFAWRSTEPATLVWAGGGLDGGDWNAKVPAREQGLMGRPVSRRRRSRSRRTEQALSRPSLGRTAEHGALREQDEKPALERTFLFERGRPAIQVDPESAKRSTDDTTKTRGWPVFRVLATVRGRAPRTAIPSTLRGPDGHPDGDRPFFRPPRPSRR